MQETVAGDPSKAAKLKVLIIDNDARVRRALRSLIEYSPDLTVLGEARSARSARRLDLELRIPTLSSWISCCPRRTTACRSFGNSEAGTARWSPSAAWASWDPRRWWLARTPSWRRTDGTWTTCST